MAFSHIDSSSDKVLTNASLYSCNSSSINFVLTAIRFPIFVIDFNFYTTVSVHFTISFLVDDCHEFIYWLLSVVGFAIFKCLVSGDFVLCSNSTRQLRYNWDYNSPVQ